MRGSHQRRNGDKRDQVEVTCDDDDTVTVEFGGGHAGLTIVGRRHEIHGMIIEADRQLSRLARRWP
ncbi:MAG: hypothetical protein AAGA93_13055 [Actinomycetota bacterium]